MFGAVHDSTSLKQLKTIVNTGTIRINAGLSAKDTTIHLKKTQYISVLNLWTSSIAAMPAQNGRILRQLLSLVK